MIDTKTPTVTTVASKAKILIVEDDPALNAAYKIVLSHAGHSVENAFNGLEALEKVKITPPDIILLDLLMPKMNGLEFLRQFAAPDKQPEVIIVVFSNLDTQQEIDEAYALGAHKHLLKAATSPKDLTELIQELLAKKIS